MPTRRVVQQAVQRPPGQRQHAQQRQQQQQRVQQRTRRLEQREIPQPRGNLEPQSDSEEDAEEDEEDAGDDFMLRWEDLQEQVFAAFPNELRLLHEKTLEISTIVVTCFILHNAYLLVDTWDSSSGVDKWLRILSYSRFTLFFPRLRIWMLHHRLYRNMRNPPTPQLLQQQLKEAQTWEPHGERWLSRCFYLWLCLLPCLTLISETELGTRLWSHWKYFLIWNYVLVTSLSWMFFVWLQSSNFINRGVSTEVLDSATTLVCFNDQWSGFGDSECGICLQQYEPNEHIRALPCRHHFHPSCVDSWLKQYRNTCPFCQRPLEAKAL